jgi:hypothetical protein
MKVDRYGFLLHLLVDKSTYKQRFSICKNCDNFQQTLKMCKECGCFIPAKARAKDSDCPVNKWGKVIDEQK